LSIESLFDRAAKLRQAVAAPRRAGYGGPCSLALRLSKPFTF
jgi:hypothetical protein